MPGDDDGVVGVEGAMLPGATESLRVEGFHTFLMNDPEVIEAVVSFLGESTPTPSQDRDGSEY